MVQVIVILLTALIITPLINLTLHGQAAMIANIVVYLIALIYVLYTTFVQRRVS